MTEENIREITEDMTDIVKLLVDDPDGVKIQPEQGEQTLVLRLWVSKADTGKVIGKQGKMAEALRTILVTLSSRRKIRAILSIEE